MRTATRLMVVTGALLACGCPSFEVVVGSGQIREESRSAKDFDEVEVTAGMNATVTYGTEQKISVRADDNLLPVIKTDVVEGRLLFQIDAVAIEPSEPVQITVQAKKLRFAGASGGGTLTLTGEPTPEELRLQAVYGSTIEATGTAKKAYLLLTQGSHGRLDGLAANDVDVDLRHDSDGAIRASGSVTGTLRDGSTLTVRGAPTSRDVALLGGSTVAWEP